MDGCTVRTVYMWGLSLVWYAGRVLWSECKNPIRSRNPVDQSYGPTSWVFAVCGSEHFCGSQCGSLIFCCCYTYILAVLVLCCPRVSIMLWCWGCWFGVYEAFCCQVLLFVCFVHVSNSWVQAQWRGALIFFFWRKGTMRLQKEWAMRLRVNECTMRFKSEWMYDAF